ncbi:6-phosphogluconolactonase [Hylemonella gracilis str. Niagara R]|uniref:6-phosphogluconolactonase n=1 Tax=Hylemonella gracilis str. Niagara R TaxID=1458275 RepID=A0A016XME1_9BURK|nr:6-phosphogluconolactonase [Hylemonella gracilis]EYC52383.1 6-phosphogluconolactonase [Hylemonella gracilis str. Niagara R]
MPMPVEHPHASAEALALDIAARLQSALVARGQALLRVSGGRSPVALFEQLRTQPLDWARVAVQLVDERLLPDGHAERNETLLRAHLLQGPASAARLLPLDEVHAAQAALTADVTVLGMGEDGHTASLFPDAPGVAEALRPDAAPGLVALTPTQAPHPRLSLNLAALLNSRHTVLSIAGPAKWAVYQRALEHTRKAPAGAHDTLLPIALVLGHASAPVAVWHAD